MVHVFLERSFDPPTSADMVIQMALDGKECFSLHKVDWRSSLLTSDGCNLFCHFHSPDAESTRIALRQIDANATISWPGTIHEQPGLTDALRASANVIVSRHFEEPVAIEDVQAKEDAGAWCLEAYRVSFIRTYFSSNRTRMICLYNAPDAESVRLAQSQAGMPFDGVWSFTEIGPGDVKL